MSVSGPGIVCGYGFGNKGINQRIVLWRNSKPRRKMVVVSPEAKDGGKKARRVIQIELGEKGKWAS